jgi:hypothetical protein
MHIVFHKRCPLSSGMEEELNTIFLQKFLTMESRNASHVQRLNL